MPSRTSIPLRAIRALAWAAAAAAVCLAALIASPRADAAPAICYRVPVPPAYCNEGEEPPPPPVPKAPPPGNVVVTGTTASSVSLAWTDNATDEYDYTISRAIGGYWTFIGRVPAQSGTGSRLAFTETGLEAERDYTYRVEVRNGGGLSYGSSLIATTRAVSVAPKLTASNVTTRSVELRWSAATGATGYVVERRPPGGSFAPVTQQLDAGARFSVDRGLSPRTDYEYRVKAVGAEADVQLSNVASIRTLGAQLLRLDVSSHPTELFRYRTYLAARPDIPDDARILDVRNVAVDENNVGLALASVAHETGFTTKTSPALGFNAETAVFNGQSLQGFWDLKVTGTSAAFLWDCPAFTNPPNNTCRSTAGIVLEITWE